jgi:Holliday junction resolvasome RuvABC endonuclease subunit
MISRCKDAKIVGLDLSLNGTGVAILRLSAGTWQRPELHTIRPIPAPSPVTRLYEGLRLKDVVTKLLALGVFESTTLVGVEDYAYGISLGKTNCVFQLGELGGCVRYQLLTRSIPYIPIPITVGKKFATGNGAAKKDQVAEKMSTLWAMPAFSKAQWDSSDALALGSAAAYHLLGGLPGLKTFQFQQKLVTGLEVVDAGPNR